MKKAVTKQQLGPRADVKTMDFFKVHFGTVNAGAEYALEAFYSLFRATLRELRGKFQQEELMLLIDGMRDRELTAVNAGQGFLNEIEDAIHLNGADKLWNVKREEIIKKIRMLSVSQRALLEVWAHGFWKANRGGNEETMEKEAMREWAQQLV
ncbi:MAG TPA: hypothetical protein DCP92_21210 [Nitrospiraceae bacterium]|nr:hypothetical protein [Nitrospiraceae bacterium]